MKKTKNNIISRWWTLAQPSKKHLFGQIFYLTCFTVTLPILTIFAAKIIDYMYARNWNMAFLYLRWVAMHFQYKHYYKQYSHVRTLVSKKVYNKILSCKSDSFSEVSKEKIINIALNNMAYISEFADSIAIIIAYIIQLVFILVSVFTANVVAGLIVSALGVLNFFAYYFFNKRLGRIMLERYEKKDDMFKTYSKVIDGRQVIREFNSSQKYEQELMKDVVGFNNAYSKYYNTYSWKVNLYHAFWKIIVSAITALMLFYVSQGTLAIATYLIIVPYLTTCTEKLNTLFDNSSNIENMRVDVDRVNLILNLSDEQLVKYGELNNVSNGYSLALLDVYVGEHMGSDYKIVDADITFKTNAINVIKGEKLGGKRTIFNLLRRQIKPESGKVLLDNLDLYNYNEKTFKTHIDYCAAHPVFMHETILENLTLVNKDFDTIQTVCQKVGVLNEILSLPDGFNTNIDTIKSSTLLFMLGLVRALLSNCKILMIYEMPQDTPDLVRKRILEFLSEFKIDKTVILFTHSDDFDQIAEVVYTVNKGIAKQVKSK